MTDKTNGALLRGQEEIEKQSVRMPVKIKNWKYRQKGLGENMI
jgi:hypothetical protein